MSKALPVILNEIKSLEPLPRVALQVMALSEKEDVTPRELIAIIQTDGGMTAKVLKLSNSAYYGFAREIASLEEAGNMLGTRALFNLVLTSCTGRYFRDYGGCNKDAMERVWETSVMTAITASTLSRLHGRVDRHRAYTAGLLLNIGRIVLERFVIPYRGAIDAQMRLGAELTTIEQRLFGMHHAEIGAQLAERWAFPDVLIDTIRHHHSPESARVDPLMTSFCHLAETITSALELDGGPDDIHLDLSDRALTTAGLDKSALAEVESLLVGELKKAREMVDSQ
ncbi:MAG: HDOD domain-containing protein [Planctomycetes bacterium]|nr:HDOD domain-containing protein [Planctomycetota bacterium]